MRPNRRRADHEELPLSGVDPFRPDRPQVQLVVLRRLQELEEAVRLEHSDIEELPADEGAHVFLVVQEGREGQGLTLTLRRPNRSQLKNLSLSYLLSVSCCGAQFS